MRSSSGRIPMSGPTCSGRAAPARSRTRVLAIKDDSGSYMQEPGLVYVSDTTGSEGKVLVARRLRDQVERWSAVANGKGKQRSQCRRGERWGFIREALYRTGGRIGMTHDETEPSARG